SALDREEFLERLRQLTDPTRPVVVVTVGLLDDADPEMLAEISRATGGSSHVAERPAPIARVLAEAIGARGGPCARPGPRPEVRSPPGWGGQNVPVLRLFFSWSLPIELMVCPVPHFCGHVM